MVYFITTKILFGIQKFTSKSLKRILKTCKIHFKFKSLPNISDSVLEIMS